MIGGYAIGKASRATIHQRKVEADLRAAKRYDELMKSDKPACMKCVNAYYLTFKRQDPEPNHPHGWGATGTYWICAKDRKTPCRGGPCKHFNKGEPKRITIRPRDEFAYKMSFDDVIKAEIEAFKQNLPQITAFFSG